MALPPFRAILVVGYNILRTTSRKYGLYILIGAAILILHSYSDFNSDPQISPAHQTAEFKLTSHVLMEVCSE